MSYVCKSIDELSTRYGGESGTGQQELYVNLGGSGWIDVDGDRVEFGPHTMIHVTPESVRQPVSGAQGLTYLCVGAPPEAPVPADRQIRLACLNPRRG